MPTAWVWATIEEIIDGKNGVFKDGDWVETKDQNPNGEVRLIQLADVGDGFFRNRSDRFMTKEKALEINCTFLKSGDILVARMPDPLGRACIFPYKEENKYVTVVDVAIIRTELNGISNKLLLNFINSPIIRKEIERLQTGTTRKRISRGNLSNISFPIPPLNEQHRIVSKIEELFSELENGVANLKLAQNQLKVYRQALLKYAFEGKLTEQWREENHLEPAEKLLERIKEERQKRYEQELKDWKAAVKAWEKDGKKGKKPGKPKKMRDIQPNNLSEIDLLPEIPKGWIYSKLGNIGLLERGKSKHRPRNDTKLFGGKYPFIQTSEVRNANVVIREFEKTYSEFGLQQSKLWNKGTLCITIAANIAETAFLGFDACFPDSVVGFIPEGGMSDVFVFYFIEYSKKKIDEFAPATAQKNINLNILDNLYIPVGSESEQAEIVNFLESNFSIIDNLAQTIESGLQKSEALRQSILKKAFEGKLVPQDPNDEPASVLLKRIQLEKKKYLEEQKQLKKRKPKNTKKMSRELSIEEVLKTSNKPMLAKDVWQKSKHKENIEDFYKELKDIQSKIKEIKKGTESLLSLSK